ncbi:hypothetical protein [Corynebacterium sp. UBA2622]|uniref:hypothetical protein n=1 Tax=Corynebacterium sp. UBA2622 TaxID=1946393 RepID=UPI0025C5A0D7|nr:hypothetical protein [Corynebacterium sp. UBA2622]
MYDDPRPSSNSGLTTGLLAGIIILLLALVGIAAYLLGSGGLKGGGGSDSPATVVQTLTSTRSDAPANNPAPAAPAAPAASNCNYSSYSAASSVTTDSFAANVYSAFKSECLRANSPAVNVVATSPVTGRSYSMSCGGSTTVYCRGGDNAVVAIW